MPKKQSYPMLLFLFTITLIFSGCVAQVSGQLDQSFEVRKVASLMDEMKSEGAMVFETSSEGCPPVSALVASSTNYISPHIPSKPRLSVSSQWFHDASHEYDWDDCEHCKNRGAVISSYYGNRKNPKRKGYAFHSGIDVRAARGSDILALKGGKIIKARRFSSYGLTVEILQYDGKIARYAHMDALYVKEGQTADTGMALGALGRTGRTTGAHLHFELHYQGNTIDPMDYLEKAEQLVRCKEYDSKIAQKK